VAHDANVTTQREQPEPARRRRVLFRPIRAVFHDPEGKLILGSVAALLAVGTIVYSFLEGWTLLDSLYFSVVTLATVGYGDLAPTTDLAKLFTIGYILTGIGIVAAFASEVAKHRIPAEPAAPRSVPPAATPADVSTTGTASEPDPAR
jgi:voltage-gated potassium channel